MNNVVLINNQEVGFEVVGNQTFTTSLDIANVFKKRHADIIAQIRALPDDDFRELNFQLTERIAKFRAVVRSEPIRVSKKNFRISFK